MRWSDFLDEKAILDRILRLERENTDLIFDRVYGNAGNLQAWYNEPNKVQEAWRGK